MKRTEFSATIICLLALCAGAAHAQASNVKADKQAQMDQAMERLKSSMSKGGSEGVASAGDGLFSALGDFSRPAGDDASVVRSEPIKSSRPKAVLANYKAPDCWEVCVSWGPLHVCYTWETRCR